MLSTIADAITTSKQGSFTNIAEIYSSVIQSQSNNIYEAKDDCCWYINLMANAPTIGITLHRCCCNPPPPQMLSV